MCCGSDAQADALLRAEPAVNGEFAGGAWSPLARSGVEGGDGWAAPDRVKAAVDAINVMALGGGPLSP
jgi:hypothetical protein